MRFSPSRAVNWCSKAVERRLDRTGDLKLTSDSGLSLIELLVSMMITAILLTVTIPVVSTFVTTTDNVQSTYAAADQILPLSTTLPRLVRSAVEPAPVGFVTAGVPVPPFVLATTPANYGPYSISFYSNIGDSNGPELVSIAVTGSAAPYTLTLTATPATAGTCPGVNASPPAGGCAYSLAATKHLAIVPNLVNGPGSGVPIFTYKTSTGKVLAQDGTPFLPTACTSTTCDSDQINYVNITLQAQVHGAPKSTISSSLYLLISTYSATVG